MPEISVILPVYNVEEYLRRGLQSIINQSFYDWEMILIDDGSTDNSGQICDEFAKNESRIRVVHKQNEGVSKARNCGLDLAQGNYIAFIDPDDYIKPDYLKNLYEKIVQENADIAIGGRTEILDDGVKLKSSSKANFARKDLQTIFFDSTYWSHISPPWGKIFKSATIRNNKIRFNEEFSYGEDRAFVLDVMIKCERITFLKSSDYFYNRIGSNLSKHVPDFITAMAEMKFLKSTIEKCQTQLNVDSENSGYFNLLLTDHFSRMLAGAMKDKNIRQQCRNLSVINWDKFYVLQKYGCGKASVGITLLRRRLFLLFSILHLIKH